MKYTSFTIRQKFLLGGFIVLLVAALILLSSITGTKFSEVSVPTRTSFPPCVEAGMVSREQIESPTQGWPIRFEVYLPPCYDQLDDVGFPVVYLIPGRGSAFTAWNSMANASEIADAMIREGKIEPFILVTTGNYGCDPQGDIFINDLFPNIDANYRTKEGSNYRVVGGASLGGINAYRMAFQHPDLIGSIGLYGSGLINGEGEQVNAWLDEIKARDMPRIFLDYGEDDLLMALSAEWMMDLLDERRIPFTLNVEPGDHSYHYWASNLEMYFLWFAEDWD